MINPSRPDKKSEAREPKAKERSDYLEEREGFSLSFSLKQFPSFLILLIIPLIIPFLSHSLIHYSPSLRLFE